MIVRELIQDLSDERVVHTLLTCEANEGLVDLLLAGLEPGDDDPEHLLDEAVSLGYVLPAWSARGRRPGPTCTLVGAPVWAAAA